MATRGIFMSRAMPEIVLPISARLSIFWVRRRSRCSRSREDPQDKGHTIQEDDFYEGIDFFC